MRTNQSEYDKSFQNKRELKPFRRFLRRNATTAEKILWKFIRNKQLGYKFRFQFSIGNVIVDFYCHSARLVVELDGWTHDSQKTKLKDLQKQRFLETQGYKVIRFTNEDIFARLDKVLEEIKNACIIRASEL